MKCKIVTGPSNYDLNDIFTKEKDDFIIGADQGARMLAENDFHFNLALGDFDSVGKMTVEYIEDYCDEILKYSTSKDYTDTYLAVKEAIKRGYDEIIIYGGIGRRFDHTYANINLLKLGNIKIVTTNEIIYTLDPGEYLIDNDSKYISFFAIEDVQKLSLRDFKYELEETDVDSYNPLCISNEGRGTVSFTEGLLLVVHQNE